MFSESIQQLSLERKLVSNDELSGIHINHIITHLVALYRSNELYCTGFMVSKNYALTLAFCLKSFFVKSIFTSDDFVARIGSNSINKSEPGYHFKIVKVHKNYDFNNKEFKDNIGVIMVFTLK